MWPVIDSLMEGLKVCETEVTKWNGHHPNTLPCALHVVQTHWVLNIRRLRLSLQVWRGQ